jgi:hypothetical protein
MWRGGVRFGLSVSDPFVCRCLSGPTMAPFPHPAHRTGRADFPHPALGQDIMLSLLHVTPFAVSGRFPEFAGFPISTPFPLLAFVLNQGPFPPSALPDFNGTTGLSATLARPDSPSRVSGWSCARPRDKASHVASAFLFHACCRHYPGGMARCVSLTSLAMAAFPEKMAGRLPHHVFRGLLSVHSRYGLHARQVPEGPSTPEASAALSPPRRL